MSSPLHAVSLFRDWANGLAPGPRTGEWECDYPHWADLRAAVLDFAATRSADAWSSEELEAVLYAIARDNEFQYLARQIRLRHPGTMFALARAALVGGEPDARWQLAVELGEVGEGRDDAERLLLAFARDDSEYVRRRALGALAALGSAAVEALALEAWHRPDESQEWARMMALDSLAQVGSPRLGALLDEAEQDPRQYLSRYARGLRQPG